MGYPDVPMPNPRDWEVIGDNYTAIPYTSPKVQRLKPEWECPDIAQVWERIGRLETAPVPSDPQTGLPRNIAGATGVSGLGRLWEFGPTFTADAAAESGGNILLIVRQDTGQLAFPGGFRNETADAIEDPLAAALRELAEETSLFDVEDHLVDVIEESNGVAELSLRNTDNAWISCARYILRLPPDYYRTHMPKAVAGEDAKQAMWVPAGQIDTASMSDAHRLAMLAVREQCSL